jgi:hypothetical protein
MVSAGEKEGDYLLKIEYLTASDVVVGAGEPMRLVL